MIKNKWTNVYLNKTHIGDCRHILKRMVKGGVKVQTVCTSPPYWNLRDYGTARWEGGSAACDHIKSQMRHGINLAKSIHSTRGGAKKAACVPDIPYGDTCGKCGARRIDAQIGLEPTIEAYVETLVEVFRLVRNVLSDDGTLWLNLGDTMLPNKCEAMIPHRVAMALIEDGWICRQTIIWHKPNPMPESVQDRCTKSHEYLFLLSKSPMYYFDSYAIRERSAGVNGGNFSARTHEARLATISGGTPSPRHPDNGWRNKRSVWTIPSEPYAGAHFATFPQKLVEPCVLAGTSERGHCPRCLARWRRVVERSGGTTGRSWHNHSKDLQAGMSQSLDVGNARDGNGAPYTVVTRGWEPGCACGLPPIPDVILDPFMGAGTVSLVAERLGRNWLGLELNADYVRLQEARFSVSIKRNAA